MNIEFITSKNKSADLITYKQNKIDELNDLCNEIILSTFESPCLGITHVFSFGIDDQMNFSGMLGAISAGIAPTTFTWKTEDAGVLTFDQSQFKQLFGDGLVFKQTNIYKYRDLKEQILSCTTQPQIDAIVW